MHFDITSDESPSLKISGTHAEDAVGDDACAPDHGDLVHELHVVEEGGVEQERAQADDNQTDVAGDEP